jgi:uncharacterized surface protein with fasciclin (FAS1) repeats
MNSLNNVNLAKRTVGLVGLLAGAAIALPVSAQIKPETESPVAAPQAPALGTQAPALSTPTSSAPSTSPTVQTQSSTEAQAPAEAKSPAEAESPATTQAPAATQAPTEAQAPTETPAPVERTQAPTAPNVAAASGTIFDVASSSDTFKTLVSALTEAELAEVLKGAGPFTVFAPTDAAFAELPAGTVEELLKPENRETLVKILKYHVVSGAYPASSLTAGQVTTIEGQPVTVAISEGKVKVNDSTVIQSDITATNGVIHAIDQVMLPPQ